MFTHCSPQGTGSHAMNHVQEIVSVTKAIVEYLREIVEGLVDAHPAQVALASSTRHRVRFGLRAFEVDLLTARFGPPSFGSGFPG